VYHGDLDSPAPPPDELARLEALRRYEVLDTADEPAFDRITSMAARVFNVPIALISLVESERQWFKSRVGLEISETQRASVFCAQTILGDEPLVIADAHADRRFSDHPSVVGGPRIRFYAGAPLRTPDGFKLGTLCVLDIVPRQFSSAELATLRDLAALVVDELELRGALRAKSMAQTALNVAQAQLHEHIELLRGIVDSAGEGILVVDQHAQTVLLNPAGAAMLGLAGAPSGWARHAWPGATFAADGCTPIPLEALPSARALRGEDTDRLEVCVQLPARTQPLWLSITGRPLRDEAGAVTGGVVTFNDITELRAARERVAELALTDELTGLPNRRAFRSLLSRLVAEGQRGRNFALVMIDIDHFKAINDTHGHPTGDAVLVAVARRLNQRVRRTDFVGRYGGEEFCILYVDALQSARLGQTKTR
jgi:PAS domain-containing protein